MGGFKRYNQLESVLYDFRIEKFAQN